MSRCGCPTRTSRRRRRSGPRPGPCSSRPTTSTRAAAGKWTTRRRRAAPSVGSGVRDREAVREERALLLSAWREFEELYGGREQLALVQARLPVKVQRKRERRDASGELLGGWEEAVEFSFPDEAKARRAKASPSSRGPTVEGGAGEEEEGTAPEAGGRTRLTANTAAPHNILLLRLLRLLPHDRCPVPAAVGSHKGGHDRHGSGSELTPGTSVARDRLLSSLLTSACFPSSPASPR